MSKVEHFRNVFQRVANQWVLQNIFLVVVAETRSILLEGERLTNISTRAIFVALLLKVGKFLYILYILCCCFIQMCHV